MAGSAAASAAIWSGEAWASASCWVCAEGAAPPNSPPIEQADNSTPAVATTAARTIIAELNPLTPRLCNCVPLQGEENGRRTADCHPRTVLHEDALDHAVAQNHRESRIATAQILEFFCQAESLGKVAARVGDEIDHP